MCSSVNLTHLAVQKVPDVLTTGSEAQLEAGTHRYRLAKCARVGRIVLPPGEFVFASTYLFHLFVHQEFPCKLVNQG